MSDRSERRRAKRQQRTPVQQVLADVALHLHCDTSRPICSRDVGLRFRDWMRAREALVQREPGAAAAYRGELLGLAAACLRIAAELPPPDDATPLENSQVAAITKLLPDGDALVDEGETRGRLSGSCSLPAKNIVKRGNSRSPL